MNRMNERVKRFYDIIKNHKNDLEILNQYQLEIKKEIVEEDITSKKYRIFAGIDVAYQENQGFAGLILFDSEQNKIIEKHTLMDSVNFPYRSTYFSFREGPIILRLLETIEISKIDLLLLNGHGLMHPRIGLASHIGYLLNIPTIGIATNYLIGSFNEKNLEKDEYHNIYDGDKIIGIAYKSHKNMKPIYLSVGHNISLMTAFNQLKKLIFNEKLPKPLIEAHNLANELKSKNT